MWFETRNWFGIPPDLIRGPQNNSFVAAATENWGIGTLDVDRLRAISRGEGVTVGVVDTGIDRTHPVMGNVKDAKDFTRSKSGPADRNGHGTHVSSTVGATNDQIGVAPACSLLHAKCLDDGGSGLGTWIAAGIRWCATGGAHVISMSLGSPAEDPEITDAMREVAEDGVIVVAAAGNSGPNTPDIDWPGRSEHCLSVAALDTNLAPAGFSSSGAKIDTAAPGVGIWGARPGGGFQQMSGTSMATPFVAGLLALYLSAAAKRGRRRPDVYGLRERLVERSTDTHTPGRDRRTGPGWLTPLLLMLELEPGFPPVG